MRTDCLTYFSAWLIILLIAAVPPAAARDHKNTFASIYVGQFSNTALNEIVRLNTDFEGTYVYVLSLGQEIGRWKDKIALEMEGQLGAYSGGQSHMEANGIFTLRWLPFPWDHRLDTSFAVGNGLSYATEEPPLEIREGNEDRSSRWLYYILVETAFALPRAPDWDVFLRIHHRSSVFGLFDGLFTASNFVGMGVRFRF